MKFQPFSFSYKDQAVELYQSAFPEEERRPTKQWLQLNEENPYFQILLIEHEGKFAGIFAYWDFSDFIYVEHFATSPLLRGKGLGRDVMESFVKRHDGVPIILEVELPKTSIALRRIGFYERQGFTIINKPYTQPPYPGQTVGLPLHIMSTDAVYASECFDQIVDIIHREVYHVKAK